MNQNNTKNKPSIQMQNSNMEEIPSIVYGLFVNGIVIDRMRRLVPKDNPTTEIVTYTILDRNNRKYYIDDYDTRGIYHALNSIVSLPVYIKAYVRKNGEPSYTLNVQKETVLRNEHF